MSFERGTAVHLVGAGGTGMTALAEVLLDRGVTVTGSDLREGDGSRMLARRGVRVVIGPHRAESVPHAVALVVRSAAVPDACPEVVVARARGIEVLRYAEAVGRLMRGRDGVAIAGTHGKTTTSAWIAHGLVVAGKRPGFVVGGDVPQLHGSGGDGGGRHFVAEACEYASSFLDLPFRIGVITNVEPDHLDWYGTFERLLGAFCVFASGTPADGALVLSPAARAVLPDLARVHGRVVVAGLDPESDVRALDYRSEGGLPEFSIAGRFTTKRVRLHLPGRHFAEDALFAATALFEAGVEPGAIEEALRSFSGVRRRLELILDGDPLLLSDYGHHPTEISAVHDALRARYPGRRLLVAFQPHQAGRTRQLFDDFVFALARFDRVLVPDIYVTRDSDADARAVSAQDLVRAITTRGGSARYVGALAALTSAIVDERMAQDAIVLLGAGDIDGIRGELQAALSSAG